LLDFVKEKKEESIIYVSQNAFNVTDLYIQETEGISSRKLGLEKLNDTILKHPLMQKEITQQKSDIQKAKNNNL
jgi:hypothetical protein